MRSTPRSRRSARHGRQARVLAAERPRPPRGHADDVARDLTQERHLSEIRRPSSASIRRLLPRARARACSTSAAVTGATSPRRRGEAASPSASTTTSASCEARARHRRARAVDLDRRDATRLPFRDCGVRRSHLHGNARASARRRGAMREIGALSCAPAALLLGAVPVALHGVAVLAAVTRRTGTRRRTRAHLCAGGALQAAADRRASADRDARYVHFVDSLVWLRFCLTDALRPSAAADGLRGRSDAGRRGRTHGAAVAAAPAPRARGVEAHRRARRRAERWSGRRASCSSRNARAAGHHGRERGTRTRRCPRGVTDRVVVSPTFRRRMVSVFGDDGRRWLDRLPSIVDEYSERWSLSIGPPLALSYNYVAPAVRADGTQAIFKCGVVADNSTIRAEIAALQHWDGDGAIRILEADPDAGVSLLERLSPGQPIVELDDVVSTRIAVGLMRRLWKPLPANHAFPTLAQWGAAFGQLRERHDGTTGPLFAALIRAGRGTVLGVWWRHRPSPSCCTVTSTTSTYSRRSASRGSSSTLTASSANQRSRSVPGFGTRLARPPGRTLISTCSTGRMRVRSSDSVCTVCRSCWASSGNVSAIGASRSVRFLPAGRMSPTSATDGKQALAVEEHLCNL